MDIDPARSPLISVVIPLYKEGPNLRPLLSEVTTALAKTGCPFELILVDDGSPDETWKIISEEAEMLPALRGVRLSRNFGKELALCAGLERARRCRCRDGRRRTTSTRAFAGHGAAMANDRSRHCRGGQN